MTRKTDKAIDLQANEALNRAFQGICRDIIGTITLVTAMIVAFYHLPELAALARTLPLWQ